LFERKIERSMELPEIKHSLTSVHTDHRQNEMNDDLTKFKEEISKVRKEIHGVKEEMNEVKVEVHDFKEEVHSMKGDVHRESRVTEKKSIQKEEYEGSYHKESAKD
jgi:archaellum component FlaC